MARAQGLGGKDGPAMDLSPRKDQILASVVSGFIQSGEPVGSKAVAQEVGVSSATVRNEMASLTELGFLEQPHTSAGRVPSQRGYREYVDRLMPEPRLDPAQQRWIDSHLGPYDPDQLLALAARLAAEMGRCAAAVTTPGGAGARVKAVQLVQTGRRTAMLLLISTGGTIKSRVFRCGYDLTTEILRYFFRVFNEYAAGKPVSEITPAFLQTLGASMEGMYALVGAPLRALLEAAGDTARRDMILSGQMNLLQYPEFGPEEVRRVLDFLEDREEMASLLDQKPGRTTVLIGREAGRPALEEASAVVARYRVDGQDAGAIAAVGPTRMDYPRQVAALEYLSQRVGRQLTALAGEE